jgi:hypothetical protein
MGTILNEKHLARLIAVIFALFSFIKISLGATESCGKVEVSAAYVHVDFLESKKTIHRMDVPAVKTDLSWKVWNGIVVKPTFLYGHGNHKDEVMQAGGGIGFCVPIDPQLYVVPLVGFNWSHLKTTLDINNPFIPLAKLKLTETFRSYSPYVAIEASYTLCKGFRVVGNVQYSWSKTKTTLKPMINPNFKEKSHSEGFTYSGMVEYDLNDHLSINMGAAYNVSLTKEKHGLRIWGGKLGVAFWF